MRGDQVGFGIVGCGMISEFQARAIGDLPDARVVAFHDAVPELARKRAEECKSRACATLDELLAMPDVQVVSICTPSGAHLEPALAAARAGKHVVVEKPLEVTVERVDAVIDACRRAGVTLGAIFPRRFNDSSRVVKDAIRSEERRVGKG